MRRSVRAAAVAVSVAALALAGCSSSGNGDANGSGDVNAPALSAINPVPRDQLSQGGELRFGITQLPTNWNLASAAGNSADLNAIEGFTMPANFESNENGELTPNPNYLTDVKVEPGPPQVVTLTLNSEAKWNDGTPITAADYIASWKANNGEDSAFLIASDDGWNQIANIEQGKDEFEVVVTFKSSYPDIEQVLSTVQRADAVKDAETFNKGREGKPVVEWMTGPFKIADLDVSQRTVALVPNENWWGDKPLLDRVSFRELDAAATPNAYANNEIDVFDNIINADAYNKALTRPDGEIRAAGGRQWRHFTVNGNSGLLQDKALRQAITKGINREAIAQSDLAGLPVKPEELMMGNHFFMPGQDGYKDNSADYAYNPEQAAKDLDALGWKLEDGAKFRTKDGQELKIQYQLLLGVPTSENEGKLFQADMEKIGVNVEMVNKSSDDFPAFLIDGEFGVTSFTWQSTIFPMANVGQIYACDGGSNYSNTCDPEIDKLRDQIQVEMDHAKRIELTNQVDKLIWDNVMTIPLYRRMEFTAVPKNLANYGAFGLSSGRVEDIGYTK